MPRLQTSAQGQLCQALARQHGGSPELSRALLPLVPPEWVLPDAKLTEYLKVPPIPPMAASFPLGRLLEGQTLECRDQRQTFSVLVMTGTLMYTGRYQKFIAWWREPYHFHFHVQVHSFNIWGSL